MHNLLPLLSFKHRTAFALHLQSDTMCLQSFLQHVQHSSPQPRGRTSSQCHHPCCSARLLHRQEPGQPQPCQQSCHPCPRGNSGTGPHPAFCRLSQQSWHEQDRCHSHIACLCCRGPVSATATWMPQPSAARLFPFNRAPLQCGLAFVLMDFHCFTQRQPDWFGISYQLCQQDRPLVGAAQLFRV